MDDIDEKDLVEASDKAKVEEAENSDSNGMEGTEDDPNNFGNSEQKEESNLQNMQNSKNDEPAQVPSQEAKEKTGNAAADVVLETVYRKLAELEQAQHDLISAANNMNGAFNREEKNFADYSARMEELFDIVERKLDEKICLAVDEYIGTFKKVTDIGNQNCKGFFKALANYQKQLGNPITTQAKTIYRLTILNTVLLAGLIALKFVRF